MDSNDTRENTYTFKMKNAIDPIKSVTLFGIQDVNQDVNQFPETCNHTLYDRWAPTECFNF